MKIVVLAGGLSPERDVSFSSGCLIANSLRRSGHRVLLLDAYDGLEAEKEEFEGLFQDDKTGRPYSFSIPETEPDLAAVRARSGNGDALIGKNVAALCRFADVVFIALHGAMGENGTIQAFFDTIGVKYTGTGPVGCLLAMDKDLTKRLLRAQGVLTADWAVLREEDAGAAETVGLPCVVKPVGAGSSIGVSIVEDRQSLAAALAAAKKVEPDVMVEKKIAGREFSVGVLEGKALPAIEIVPKAGFYDYKNKYQSGLTDEICPARLSGADAARLGELALKVHGILRLGSYSRVDFIQDAGGDFYCLEANTLPGMTPASLLPQEARAVGIDYDELCGRIVEAALRRKNSECQ